MLNTAAQIVQRNWWIMALRGLLAVIFGLIALLAPGIALLAPHHPLGYAVQGLCS